MSLEALPGQAPGPQSTDQKLPSWLTYSAYTTLTQTYTRTRETVLYDPNGLIGPTVSTNVEVGVTTTTLYVAKPVPLLYTGPTPYPPLGTLYTVSGQRVGPSSTGGSSAPTSTRANSAPIPGQSSGMPGSSGITPAPAPSASSSRPSATASEPPSSNSGVGSNPGSSITQSQGGGGSSTGLLPPGASNSAGTTFLPSGTSVVGGTTFLPGSTGGSNPTSIISGTTVGPTAPASSSVVSSGTTFLPGATSIASGTTFLPGPTSIYSGTTVIDGTSTIINPPAPSGTLPGGENPLQRQSSGLTPAQLAGTLVGSILGFLLLLALLLYCLLRRQRRKRRQDALEQSHGIGPEKYQGAIANDPSGAGYGASGARGSGEKSALLGLGAAAGAGAAAGTGAKRSSSFSNWFTSRGNRIPSDSAAAGGGTYTALPQANVGPNSRHARTGSGGSALGAGLVGASAATVAAIAAISSRRRRRREEREQAGVGPWASRKGALGEDEWEADELDDDGGSGFFVVGGRNPAERGESGTYTAGGRDEGDDITDPFADVPQDGPSSTDEHRAEGIAAAAGAAVIAAGRGRNMPNYNNRSGGGLMVNDPSSDARKSRYHDMANLGVGGGGGSGPRFFGAMMGTRSASGTDSGTGSNSNSGPSQRNVSGGTHLTPGTQQPSVRSVSNPTYNAAQDSGVSTYSGGGGGAGSGMMYGLTAAAAGAAAALGLSNAARRISSGEKRLSRKPVPQYASSGTDTEAEDNPAYLGKRKRVGGGRGPGGLYGAVGTGPVGEEDEEEDQPGPRVERQGLMQDYGADPYEADRSTGNYKVGAGWPEAALVGAAAGAAVGGGAAAAAARRSHRRSIHGAEGQTSSGSGSGNAWSSGSTHEVPKSSSGVLISGSSAGHRSGSLDEAVAGGSGGGVTSLSPPPRPARSRTSTAGSLKDPAGLTSLANVGSSGSPQDRVRLPAFPEGFGEGDLHDHAGVAPQGSSQPQTTTTGTNNFLGPDSAVLAEAAAAGTGGALGLLAAQHRTSMASMYDYQSEGHSQSVRTPDESELPSRHSNFLSRGTHLLGPGAAGSSRSSAMSSLENPDGGAEAAGSGDAAGRAGSSQLETLAVPTVTEFGEQQAHQSKSRTTLNSGHLGRQLSTIFGSESEPSLGVGQSSSAQQLGYVASAHGSGTGSSSGRDSNIESLGARSGSAGAGAGASITTNMRSARGSGASDGRVPPSLIGAIQRGQGHVDASPTGTFGVADLAGSPPSSPRRTSLVSGGIRVVGPTQAARVSRSPTPGTGTGVPSRVPSAERGSGLGLAGADSSRARSPDDGDLEAASTEDLAHDHSEAGLLSSVAAGLRRLGGGWLPGGGVNRPGAADAGGFGRRTSIGVATMGARTAAGTAVGTPTGQGTPARPETAQSGEAAAALAAASRRTSGVGVSTGASSSMSSIQRPDLARLSTATSQAVAGSREGSGSEPSAGYSASLSSGERSAGLDSVSHLTHNSSSAGQRSVHGSRGSGSGSHRSRGGRSEGSNSGPSTHSAGTGSGSGFSYTTSELARRNTLSTHAEMDEEAALRRASLSGATSPAVYTASEGASAESHSAAAARRDVPVNAGPTVDPQPRLTNPASAAAPNAQSTIRAVGADRSGRPGLPDFPAHPVLMPGLPGALPIRGPTGSPSGSWRQSPRVASLSQRAVDVQARTAEGSPAPARSSGTGSGSGDHRNRSQSVVASSPDDFEWRDLADTFPTPLDRALREAEQRDLEEQTQGRQQNRYDWPKFLRF